MHVSGCGNPTVSNIIKGAYTAQGTNHGKPVYKKEGPPGGVNVLVYFWDERDGPSFSGWWFGPKVGGDQVWAYHGDGAAALPPASGWRVPWDGPVDQALQLTAAGGPSTRRPNDAPPPSQPPARAPRQDDEDGRRRDIERQRAALEQQRRDEEQRRRREMEERRRQKEREEEQARKQAELKKRREEEEIKQREQAAALAVRKVIQKVRVATPETYDKLRCDLEEAQASHLDALGSQAEKVSQEAEQALQQAQKRIDEINERRIEDERRRLEEERRQKEEAALVERLVKEMAEEVQKAEGRVSEVQESSKGACEDEGASPESMVAKAEAAEKAIEVVREVLESASKSLVTRQEQMGENEAARKVKREVGELHGRVASGRRALDKLTASVKQTREKAARKAAALKKEQDRMEQFKKHDGDKDGKLSRMEVMAFSRAVHDFELPEETLNKIMRILEPVMFEKFLSLHQKVAIAKSEVQARERRKEEEQRRKALEEKRLAVRKVVDEAAELLTAAEATVGQAEDKTQQLAPPRDAGLAAEAMREAAAAGEALAGRADAELTKAMERMEEVEAACAATPELGDLTGGRGAAGLRQRHQRAKGRAEKVEQTVKAAYERAVRKAYAEVEQRRSEAVKAIWERMGEQGKNGEQLFADIGGGSAVSRETFITFLKGLKVQEGQDLNDQQAEQLFQHIAGDAAEIGKEKFLELIRLFYKCVKGTVLSEDVSIKSKTIRRLEVGEVLEALEGPSKEEGAGVRRVKCQCVQDDAVGWATIAGNQGTAFLEPGGNFYTCIKETVLTDGLSVQDSKTIRRIARGEVIEVLDFAKRDSSLDIKRIRGKAKQDGAVGWITVCGNQGTSYLEPC